MQNLKHGNLLGVSLTWGGYILRYQGSLYGMPFTVSNQNTLTFNIYPASFLRNNRTRCKRDTRLDFHAVSHYQSEQQCELRLNIWSLPPTIAAHSQRVKLIMSWICPFMFNGLTENPHTIAPYSNKTSTQSGLKNWWLNLVKWNLGFVQDKFNTTTFQRKKKCDIKPSSMIKQPQSKNYGHLTGRQSHGLVIRTKPWSNQEKFFYNWCL